MTNSTVSSTSGTRSLEVIAAEVRRDWKNIYFGARPYLEAMACLDKVSDNYGSDSGQSIVAYFLTNSSSWRGQKAREIKKELKKMAGIK